MCSYNSVNGVPSCANKDILTTKARLEWGFDGYITSDWYMTFTFPLTITHISLFVRPDVLLPPWQIPRPRFSRFASLRVLEMVVFVWLCALCSLAVYDVLHSHHYTNTTDATILAVLQAGMVRVYGQSALSYRV
jgi:hypothetical protein